MKKHVGKPGLHTLGEMSYPEKRKFFREVLEEAKQMQREVLDKAQKLREESERRTD